MSGTYVHRNAARRSMYGAAAFLVLASAVGTTRRASAAADPAPPSHIPLRRSSQLLEAPAGVNTSLPREPYLSLSERWWTRMFDAGMKYVRIGQYEDSSDQTSWDWVEQKKGQLKVNSEVDESVNSLVANGTTIELQLLYGNPLYTSQSGAPPAEITPASGSVHNWDRSLNSIFWAPITPPQIAAFLAYTKFMVEHFRGRVQYYSLWNEPDISYWNPYPSPEAYGRLLGEFVKVVHETDPNAKVVSAGLAERSPEFARKFLAACECAADLDVFAYHIYPGGFASNTPPERMDSADNGNRTTTALRAAVSQYPGIKKDIQFWNDEYNSVTGFTPEMDDAVQAKYVARAVVYNWAQKVPTFLWELINDTNTDEGNTFGIINGKMFSSSDFQPKPVFYAIARTNAVFGDTRPDPQVNLKVVDGLSATKDAPFFSCGFKSRAGKSIVAYWLGSKSPVGQPASSINVQVALQDSGIVHPVLIDIDADTITPIAWEKQNLLRVPVRDSVMAIADASYFDWMVLPEIPGGLTATRAGTSVALKWQAAGSDASELIVEGQRISSTEWVSLAHLPATATSYQISDSAQGSFASYRIYATNQAGKSGYSTSASIHPGSQ